MVGSGVRFAIFAPPYKFELFLHINFFSQTETNMLTDFPGLIKNYLANFHIELLTYPPQIVLLFRFSTICITHSAIRICRSGCSRFALLPAGFFWVCLEARPVIYHQRKISFSATGQVPSDAIYFYRGPGSYHLHPGTTCHRIIELPAKSACG